MKLKFQISSSSVPVRCLTLTNLELMKVQFKKLGEIIKQVKTYLNDNKSILYFSTTAFFLMTMFVVLVHGLTLNNNIVFETITINEPQPFASHEITVTKLTFNPKTKLHRMDIFLSSTQHNIDFFNHQIEVIAVTQAEPSTHLEVEIKRVTNQFFVLYIKDLAPNFGAIRKDIDHFTDQTQTPTSINLRFQESQSAIDYTLIINDQLELIQDALHNDIRILKQQIKELEALITTHEQQLEINLTSIDQTKTQMEFEVGINLAQSQSRIESLTNQNTNIKNEIREIKKTISEHQDDVKLISQTINEL